MNNKTNPEIYKDFLEKQESELNIETDSITVNYKEEITSIKNKYEFDKFFNVAKKHINEVITDALKFHIDYTPITTEMCSENDILLTKELKDKLFQYFRVQWFTHIMVDVTKIKDNTAWSENELSIWFLIDDAMKTKAEEIKAILNKGQITPEQLEKAKQDYQKILTEVDKCDSNLIHLLYLQKLSITTNSKSAINIANSSGYSIDFNPKMEDVFQNKNDTTMLLTLNEQHLELLSDTCRIIDKSSK